MKLIPLTYFLFLSISGFGQNDLYKKHTDSLASMNRQLPKCVEKNPTKEVDCHKEYFHILKDMKKELYFAIRTMLTGDALKKLENEEVAWEDSSYWYYAKTFRWFKDKHPSESILRPSDKAKPDALKALDDNAAYVKKRMAVLLTIVNK